MFTGNMTSTDNTNINIGIVDRTTSMIINHNIDPISNDVRHIMQVILYLFMCGIVSLFGIGSNIANMMVFVRQGFKDSINVSLLGLDFSSVLTMFVISLGFNPLLDVSKLSVNFFDVMYLTVGWPHVFFNRVSSFITAFISLERCICVIFPLTVKNIFTSLRTTIIIVLIFSIIFIFISPFYFVNKLEWCYNQYLNKTMLSLAFTKNRVDIETATFPIHSVFMPTTSLLIVIICTIILVVELNRKSKWRESSSTQNSKMKSSSVKDKKVVKMVVFMSTIYIICCLPSTLNFLMMTYEPEFSIIGQYMNLYILIWSITVLIETVNSSVNVFVYFNMSTKFRETFVTTFSCRGLQIDGNSITV